MPAFITVVIPARDEAANLPALLADLQKQNLPAAHFEVLVVDDHSTDSTPEIVRKTGGNIRLVNLAEHVTGPVTAYKKKAIEVAIAEARGSIIVTTDADCRVKANWLQTISNYFYEHDCEFLVMPVVIKEKEKFLHVFQSLDFMSMQGITGAAVHKKWHYMCNGANLAYLRQTFYDVNGFEGIDDIASGDDMLLMEKVAAKNKSAIHFLKDDAMIVETAAAPSLKAFIRQRARWAGKAGHYNDSRITIVLLLVYALNVSLLLMPLAALLFRTPLTGSLTTFFFAWLSALTFKTIVEMIFLQPVAKFFDRLQLMKYFPLAQPFHIIYIALSGFIGLAGKQDWKGRKV